MEMHYAILNDNSIVETVITTDNVVDDEKYISIVCHDVYLPDCYYDKTSGKFIEPVGRIRIGKSPILDK